LHGIEVPDADFAAGKTAVQHGVLNDHAQHTCVPTIQCLRWVVADRAGLGVDAPELYRAVAAAGEEDFLVRPPDLGAGNDEHAVDVAVVRVLHDVALADLELLYPGDFGED